MPVCPSFLWQIQAEDDNTDFIFFGKNIPSTASCGIPDLLFAAFDRLSATGLSLPVPHHQKLLAKV